MLLALYSAFTSLTFKIKLCCLQREVHVVLLMLSGDSGEYYLSILCGWEVFHKPI